jgi:hypothetical protein
MKKTVLLTLASNILYSVIFCQRPQPAYRNEDLKIKNFSRKTVELKPFKGPVFLQNLKSIEVVDARADSTAIGLASVRHMPFFTVSQGRFSDDAQQFLNSSIHFTKPDTFSLVMVLKKFWLTSGLDEEMEQQIQNTEIDSSSKKISSLLVRIEFYLKRASDHFILYRYDTMITRNLYVSRDASALVEQALIFSISRLQEMESKFQSITETRRKFNRDEIDAHNQKQYDLPVLKDSSLARGVYFSFEEFKNNRPGQKDFEVEKDKLIDLIFTKQADGTLAPIRDAWGYCDGKNLYIRSMDNYFMLQRECNAFYIYGAKEFKHKKRAKDPAMGVDADKPTGDNTNYTNTLQKTSKRHLALELKPYELDWDNGELN